MIVESERDERFAGAGAAAYGSDADDEDDDIAHLVRTMMQAPASGAPPGASGAGGDGSSLGARVETLPTVADDYIRNFLIRCGMRRSLDAFNTEWYELRSKGALPDDDALAVPDIYAQHERLGDAVNRLRVELAHAQEIASKAQQQWEKLRRERDLHRMHHKRVAQEKDRLVVEMKRLKTHFESFEPTMRELRAKYEGAMRDKLLLKVERDKLFGRIAAQEAQVELLQTHADGGGSGGGAALRATAATAGGASAMALRAAAAGSGPRAAVRAAAATPVAAGARGGGGGGARASPTRRAGGGGGGESAAGAAAASSVAPLPEDSPNPYAGLAFESAHVEAYSAALAVRAHGAAVTGVAFHPSRPVLATVSDDATWRLWSLPEGELVMTGEGHRSWIAGVDFHPYGSHLATCSGDGIVKVWDLGSAACTATLADHGQTVWDLAWHSSGDFLLSAGMDQTCRLFDVGGGGGRVRQTLRGHVGAVNAVAWQPYSALAATASGDKSVSLWDTRTALCVQTFYGHSNAVNDVAFALQGDALVSCDADGGLRLWDVRRGAERAVFHTSKGAPAPTPLHAVALDRSGACIAAAGEDGVVRVLTADAGAGGVSLRLAASLKGHDAAVQAVAFDPTSSYLVSAGDDCTVRCWSEGGAMPDLRGAAAALAGEERAL